MGTLGRMGEGAAASDVMEGTIPAVATGRGAGGEEAIAAGKRIARKHAR